MSRERDERTCQRVRRAWAHRFWLRHTLSELDEMTAKFDECLKHMREWRVRAEAAEASVVECESQLRDRLFTAVRETLGEQLGAVPVPLRKALEEVFYPTTQNEGATHG